MDAHAHDQHAHPTPGLYAKVALVLFALTALEVMVFEIAGGHFLQSLQSSVAPVAVLILLVLSAAKFALVAMFYMHLKQDPRLLSNLFVFPIIIAAVIIVMLVILFSYWRRVGAL